MSEYSEIEKSLKKLHKRSDIEIEEITSVFSEIKRACLNTPNTGREFEQLLQLFRNFLQIVQQYMLTHGDSPDEDLLIEMHKIAYDLIVNYVRNQHNPRSTFSVNASISDQTFASLIPEDVHVDIETEQTSNLTEEADLTALPEGIIEFEKELKHRIASEDTLTISIAGILKEPRNKQIVILSLISNLPDGKELEKEGERFTVHTVDNPSHSTVITFKV